jgi:cell division protein FtsW
MVSGAPMKQILKLVPIAIVIFALLAVAAPYRLERITTFFQPNNDPLGSSYQIRQAILAIGSGGWTGVGIGKSRQKYEYLPEANTDSIFAIVAEEVGFIGALVILTMYLIVIFRGFMIAKYAPDMFSRLIVVGVVSWFGFQSAINIGAIVKLMPLTGVPLPLISSGGSSFMVLMIAFGIVLNISRYKKTVS